MATGTIIPQRKLGSIVADITIEETGQDELTITEHPVEQGASISDHAYKQPATLTLRLGWSNSSANAGGDEAYVRDIYAKLLALQVSRVPFDIVTGKRDYSDMLLRSLALTTDQTTETALFITAVCRQVIIVSTSAATLPSPTLQKAPAKTADVTPRGTVQPDTVTAPPAGSGP